MDQTFVKRIILNKTGNLYTGKLILFLLLVILALPHVNQAQDQFTIRGKVVNQEGSFLMGNVIALSVKDSSFIKGNTFMEGHFELTGLSTKEVLLKLSSLQFKDTVLQIAFKEAQTIDLGEIVVNDQSQTLKEVTITGTAPLFTTRPDGVMEVNVSNTVLATSNSITEILSRSPTIISGDEGISVFGKGQAILYLNGKRITQERLSSISPSQVKSIEIIANPGAIYDAEGAAVINIITKDDLPDGYKATAQQQVTWSEQAGILSSSILNFNYKKRKLDIAGNYDLKRGNENELLYTNRIRPAENDYLNSQLRWEQQRDFKSSSNYSLGVSYDMNGRGYASLEYNGSHENNNDYITSLNYIITPTENGQYATTANRTGRTRNHSVTLNVNTILDSLSSSLFTGGQLSQFRSALHDDIIENNTVNDQEISRLLKSDQSSDIIIFNPQVDYIKGYTAGGKLSIGTKFSYANVASDLRFYRSATNTDYQPDQQRSNDFKYKESVPAAYIQYEGAAGTKIAYGLGLRSEWTHYTLYTSYQAQRTLRADYVNFFPNAQINFSISQQLKLRASYTSRITRPPYQALSPSLIYQDAFTSVEGNPNLLPEKTHAFELGASYTLFDLKAGYNYTIDPLSGAALRGADEKSYVLTRINFSKGHSCFTSLSTSISWRWLTSTNTISMSYTRLIDNQYGYEQVGAKPQVYAYTSNKISVGNLFKVNVLAWYLGEKYYSLRYDERRSIVTMGIEKEFLKLFKCSFTANDIFNKSNPAGSYTVGQTLITFNRLYTTSYYRLALTCTFGQLKKTLYKSKSISEAENSRAR